MDDIIVFFEVFICAEAFKVHQDAKHTKVFPDFLKGKVAGDGPHLTFLNQVED